MPLSTPAALLFDLDGTLIDTAADFHRAVNRQRERHRLQPLEITTVRQNVSEGSKALIRVSFAIKDDHHDFDRLRQELLTDYLANIAVDSQLFSGFEHVLSVMEASSLPWGIVTNKPRLYAEALLEQLGLITRSAALVCPDDVSRTKPHPEPLLKAADQLQQPAQQIWYVGDHARDIEAGRSAGMRTIAAAYGYIPAGESVEDWRADHVIDSPSDLLTMLSL